MGPAIAALTLCLYALAPAARAETATSATELTGAALLDRLSALAAGELPPDVPVGSLFAVRLVRPDEVGARMSVLEGEQRLLRRHLESLENRQPGEAGPEGGAPAAELAEVEQRLAIVSAKLAYLGALASSLRGMPEAGRRLLPGLGETRAALRGHAEALVGLAGALSEAAGRLETLRARLISGALVGFVADARETVAAADLVIRALQERSRSIAATATAELSLAEDLESRGRALTQEILVSVQAPDRATRVDALFFEHLYDQRRLQRAAHTLAGGLDAIERLGASAGDLAPRPDSVGTVSDAAASVDTAGALVSRATGLDSSVRNLAPWRLAFENEAVTVLSGLISDGARHEAYAWSSTILRDVRTEAGVAWERAGRWIEELRGEYPEARTLWSTPAGREMIARTVGIASVLAAWTFAARRTGPKVTAVARVLATASRRRLRPGTIVRWSGLVEATLPVLLAVPALLAMRFLLGSASTAAALLNALALPFLAYALGRQVLLGSTRRITHWRPALIEVPPARLAMLRSSYARLGLVIASAAALTALAQLAIGAGMIVVLVNGLALAWIAVWLAWEAVEWRGPLAAAWQRILPEDAGRERRAVDWMSAHRSGFVLSPVALGRLLGVHVGRPLLEFSRRTDLAQILEARRLRRRSQKADEAQPRGERPPLPAEYLSEFPLHPLLGDEGALMLPREDAVAELLGQIERWRETRSQGSIALIGEKGSGKSTLASLVARSVEDLELVEHTLVGKPCSEDAILTELGRSLPVDPGAEPRELDAWIEALREGPERVVVVDEAHNVFLRTVGGYRAYDTLVQLVNATSSRVFWLLTFNAFTWRFLNESRSRLHYFRKLFPVPRWTTDEIRELVRRRNERTGYEVEFDELLLSGERASGLELIEGAEGFFRLLTDSSGGNPRIATRLWLASLEVIGEKKLRVTGFREASDDVLNDLGDDLLFALAAICQHENLSTGEIARVLNVSDGLARFAVQYLSESGLIVPKDVDPERFTLGADHYRQVLRVLRNRHLLFE